MWTVEQEDLNADSREKKLSRKLKYKLYLNRILSSWGDRMWQFCIGLFFIHLSPGSFTLASIHGIISSVIVLFCAPFVGRWIEKTSRLREVQISLFLQNGFTALSAVCVLIFELKLFDENTNKWVSQIGLIAFSIVAQIWSIGYTTCLEKDWLLCIANNEIQLTDLNAILRRLDLICSLISPLLVGIIMNRWSLLGSAIFLASFNVLSAFVEYSLLISIYKSVPNLRKEKVALKQSTNLFNLSAFLLYFKSFLTPGLSFSLLYLTILGFDPITIGYASEKGINEIELGFVTLASGFMGVIGTLCYPYLVRRFGVKKSALIGFISETICLVLCLADAFKFWITDERLAIILFLTGVTAARFGLWIADMGVNQLIQTTTSSPPLISSVQTSVNILMELIKFLIVFSLPKVDHFWLLILISFSSVMLGTIIFSFYTFGVNFCRNSQFPITNEE